MDTVIRIEGHFDVPAALALREKTIVAEEPAVVLDFSHVEHLDDSTLALLTVNLVLLSRRGHGVTLLGLREHHCRVLAHFGVDVGTDGSVRIAQS